MEDSVSSREPVEIEEKEAVSSREPLETEEEAEKVKKAQIKIRLERT